MNLPRGRHDAGQEGITDPLSRGRHPAGPPAPGLKQLSGVYPRADTIDNPISRGLFLAAGQCAAGLSEDNFLIVGGFYSEVALRKEKKRHSAY